MQYLLPWYLAMKDSEPAFKQVMEGMGVNFEEEWATKESVVAVINQLCNANVSQADIWRYVYDSRRSFNLSWMFPDDPIHRRKRSWCHLYEAWYTIALMCAKYDCLHLWLCHFILNESLNLVEAKTIIFTDEVVVNGVHIEGSGVINL